MTEKNDVFVNVIDTEGSTTKDIEKLNRKLNKIKFTAFVKVKTKRADSVLENLYKKKYDNAPNKEIDKAINDRILETQKEEFENEVENILMMKKSKGKSSAIFHTLKSICGDKKAGQEQICMKDPETGLQIFDPRAIKKASLKYCQDLLNTRNGDNEYETYYFVQKMIHVVRSHWDKNEAAEEALTKDDFDNRLKLLKKKCKEKYNFILKSGDGLKNCLFDLFSKVWSVESKPEQWKETVIIQLYKGVGDPSSYNCQRNIHTKADCPKFFEGIVVDKSKAKIVEKCSKFQIGGIPGHRPQEHLFTAKSIIALYNYFDIPLFLQI